MVQSVVNIQNTNADVIKLFSKGEYLVVGTHLFLKVRNIHDHFSTVSKKVIYRL